METASFLVKFFLSAVLSEGGHKLIHKNNLEKIRELIGGKSLELLIKNKIPNLKV